MILAVDPGTRSVGVAARRTNGIVYTVCLESSQPTLDGRLRDLHGKIEALFRTIKVPAEEMEMLIEDGVYRVRSDSISKLAEARGMVMAAAWRRGWKVRRVNVQSWKRLLMPAERAMKKTSRYVAYFNLTRGWSCRTADEVDAALMLGCA